MAKKSVGKPKPTFKKTLKEIVRFRGVYLIMLPAIVWYILFSYVPMAGLSLAFKTYKAKLGIWGSPYTGFTHFEKLFKDPRFLDAVLRTLKINGGRLILTFPFAIILALLLNELRMGKFKKVLQVTFTFPHFLSWVIIASIITNVLSYDGLVNSAIELMGGEYVNFIGNSKLFVPLVYITEVWKGAGWSSIIYMAAIAGIDQEQFEAADIDGASRWDKMWRITLPSILPTITIMFILAAGNVMTKGFDQVFNMDNAAVHKVSQTLDMYIYNVTFNAKKTDFGYSTAISMFRSVVNLTFLVIANTITKKLGGNGLMGGGD
ncbi:MAG: sugar ABC transporter permease [Lachnospiraceae bacterium]|nr:sugar ABC transporter permease [Lachnospiraceae bacterium]